MNANEIARVDALADQAQAMLRDRLAASDNKTLDQATELAELVGNLGGQTGALVAQAIHLMVAMEKLRRAKESAGEGGTDEEVE